MALYNKKDKFHFRHHKIRKHNTLIVGEDKNNYDFLLITTSPRRDKSHLNAKFKKNPKKDLKAQKKIIDSYYEKRLGNDVKRNFADLPLKTWYLSNEDYFDILKLLEKKSKKK